MFIQAFSATIKTQNNIQWLHCVLYLFHYDISSLEHYTAVESDKNMEHSWMATDGPGMFGSGQR